MKKFLIVIALATAGLTVSAQKNIRLNFYTAYTFDDGFDVYNDANSYYHGKISGGTQIGGGLEFMPDPHYGVELIYLHRSMDAPTTFKVGTLTAEKTENFDVKHDYILISGDRHALNKNGKVEGYGGLMAGVVFNHVEAPTTGSSSSNSNFAWGARLGANIWFTNKIGLKLQSQILSASRATGGEVWFSYWGPVSVPTYSTVWQFSLGGGLTFRLGK